MRKHSFSLMNTQQARRVLMTVGWFCQNGNQFLHETQRISYVEGVIRLTTAPFQRESRLRSLQISPTWQS